MSYGENAEFQFAEHDDLVETIQMLRAELSEIRDLARTSLAPDALGLTGEAWLQHKLDKIAVLAQAAIGAIHGR